MRILSFPFDIAANGIGQRYAHASSGQMFFENSFEIIRAHFTRVARIIDPATRVNEREIFVEDVKMRGSQCPVC